MEKYFITFCFLLLSLCPLQAQIFEYIDMEDGLSSRRVLSIQQDKQGYMWILTHKGTDRYDGKRFTHYKLFNQSRNVYFYPDLNTLCTDSKHTLWEYGKDGYAFYYDELKDSFRLVFDLRETYPNLKKEPITATYFDASDNIWFCCDNKFILYNTTKQTSRILDQSIQGNINFIAEESKDIFYFSTSKRIYQVKFNEGKEPEIDEIRIDNIVLINYIYFHQPTNKLIISTLLKGMFLYDPQKKQINNIGNALKDIDINTIKPYKTPDEVLIATDGNGVYKLNVRTKKLEHFLKEDYRKPNKMNGSIIKDIYMDKYQRIWNVIYPTGITIYSERYPEYDWIKHSLSNTNSLIDSHINAILQDSDGDIWYATSNGICCFETKRKRWKNYLSSFTNETQNENHIFISLCEIKPGVILTGGYMSGTYRIEKKTGKVIYRQQTAVKKGETPDKYVRSIYTDNEKTIWMGSFYNLRSYNLNKQESRQYPTIYPITHVSNKDGNTLWVGTINGLYVFDKQKGALSVYDEKLETGCINTIYQTEDGKTAYIGTYGKGLFVIDNQTGQYKHHHTANSGLITNNIYSIVPNKYGHIFLGTENGVSQFNIHSQKFINWTKEQGLLSANFNQNAAINTGDGHMIFGSNDGAIILPDTITLSDNFSSHMVFSDLNIMYRTVHPQEKGSPLKKLLDQTSSIRLAYNQNTFSLNVSSINYNNPSNILYSWKLEGFYDQWSVPSANNLIRYTNLSPGDYTLKVRSILMDNSKVLEERSIQILVDRPYWLTFWAFLIYALLLAGIIYAIIRYQMIRRDRCTSQEKIDFFVHTAHDIRTPLTLIKAPLGEILKNEQLSEHGLMNINLAIQNTDNLSELANKLMNFQKEELYSSRVTVSKHELNSYIQNYLKQFESYAEQKGLTLKFESQLNELDVWIDTNKIDPILRNLLSNALKYTHEGGIISVKTGCTKSHWTLTISDTGIGISKQDQKKLFKFLFRGTNATNQLITGSGIGMLLTYRLIQNHEGKISFSSTENVGTSFRLSFPIRSSHYIYKDKKLPQEITSMLILQDNTPEQLNSAAGTAGSANQDAPLILIVEDNAALRSFLCQSLADHYRTEGAENGEEALKKLDHHPDLIISDVMMPVMDGHELCRRVKNNVETSHIPIILLTALGDREHILSGLETKADLYIVKPFDLTVLKANISNVLENRELMRRRFQKKLQDLPEAHDASTEDMPENPTSLDDEFLKHTTTLIKEGLGEGMNVDTLCAAVNMSRTSFYNKIKALTGMAPNELIRNIRMQEAALLLKSQRYTVAEVSDRMGFADPKYFTDTFKKFYGMPPSTYMKQNHSPINE